MHKDCPAVVNYELQLVTKCGWDFIVSLTADSSESW